jgi:hypothetical protein
MKNLLGFTFAIALFSVSAVPVFAATPCDNKTVEAGQQWTGDMNVPSGTICQVQAGATVTGNVTVEGYLISNGGHFMGNVVVTGASFMQPGGSNFTIPTIIDRNLTIGSNAWIRFTGASAMNEVKGNVTATNGSGFIFTATKVGKNLTVSGATGDIYVEGVDVANNGTFTANEGPIKVWYSTFGQNLNGSDNAQQPTGSNNVAKQKNGQFSSLN